MTYQFTSITSNAGRTLAQARIAKERAPYRAKAREMREQLEMPVPEILRA